MGSTHRLRVNPDGRARGGSLTALLRQRLDEVEPESGKTYGQLVIDGWLEADREAPRLAYYAGRGSGCFHDDHDGGRP